MEKQTRNIIIIVSVIAILLSGADVLWKMFGPCKNRTDIMFMIDDSGSVTDDDFTQAKKFIFDVMGSKKITLDDSYVRIGLATFSSEAKWMTERRKTKQYKHVKFTANPETIKREIRMYKRMKEETNTVGALEFVRDEMIAASRNSFGTKTVLIFMTDGKSQLDGKPLKYNHIAKTAGQVKAKGVSIYTIGVGQNVDDKELKAISSGEIGTKQKERYMYNANKYAELSQVLESLEDKLCSPNYWLAVVPLVIALIFIGIKLALDRREATRFDNDANELAALDGKRTESALRQK